MGTKDRVSASFKGTEQTTLRRMSHPNWLPNQAVLHGKGSQQKWVPILCQIVGSLKIMTATGVMFSGNTFPGYSNKGYGHGSGL